MSLDVSHGMRPRKYSGRSREGVPPPVILTKSPCGIQLHGRLKEIVLPKKMGIPQLVISRGDAPQGGNSHVFDSGGDALLRQAEAVPAIAALSHCQCSAALSDDHKPAQWPLGAADR